GRRLLHLERRLRVLGAPPAPRDRPVGAGERRRAPHQGVRGDGRRPGRALLLRGAQQDLDDHALVVPRPARARALQRCERTALVPHVPPERAARRAAARGRARPARRGPARTPSVGGRPRGRRSADARGPGGRGRGGGGTVTPFSVLLPVYHGDDPAFLRRSFASVTVEQELAPAEVVLVEDGPVGDALARVLDELEGGSPVPVTRVRLERNQGLATALEAGLARCAHEIVARQDADDVSRPARFAV